MGWRDAPVRPLARVCYGVHFTTLSPRKVDSKSRFRRPLNPVLSPRCVRHLQLRACCRGAALAGRPAGLHSSRTSHGLPAATALRPIRDAPVATDHDAHNGRIDCRYSGPNLRVDGSPYPRVSGACNACGQYAINDLPCDSIADGMECAYPLVVCRRHRKLQRGSNRRPDWRSLS